MVFNLPQGLTLFFDFVGQLLVDCSLLFLWWKFQSGTAHLTMFLGQNPLQEFFQLVHT